MKSLKAKFRKTDTNEWSKNDERLLAAVEHGEVEKVAALLAKKGASAVKLDSEGKSALHLAAIRGQTDCLSAILAHGTDLSVTDAAGCSALHLAAKNNHPECAKKLLQSKCAVDTVDGSGRTALHHAAANGNVQTVHLLCEHKSPVNLRDTEGFSPLLLSVRHAHPEVCSTLIDWGADVNASDTNGRTALMLASESSSVAVVEVLLGKGAELNTVDSLGHDLLHYAKLSGSAGVRAALTAALHRLQAAEPKSPRSPQHGPLAKLSDERITTPKKRKAPPPPPISPLQNTSMVSPPFVTPNETPVSSRSESRRFNYKEEEVRGAVLREEVEKLQEEKSMLLETIEDLKQIVEQTVAPGPGQDPQAEHSSTATAALVSALQAKITALTLENHQLASILKKRPSPQGGEDLRENSRPSSMASNSSFHSTQDDFEASSARAGEGEGTEGDRADDGEGEGRAVASDEEIRLLRQALESVQSKLLESRKENRSLQAKLKPGAAPPGRSREREQEEEEEEEVGREEEEERGREEELLESLAELQAKLTETQERYHQAVEEVQELRMQAVARGGAGGGDAAEMQEAQRRRASLEQEVRQLKAQLVQTGSEQEKAVHRVRQLEEALRRTEVEKGMGKGKELERRQSQIEQLYREAQEEIKMLQEALMGTVPVERAAKDFDEMKGELNEVIAGLQRRLLELSHSFSDTKSQLSATQRQLAEVRAESEAASSCSSPPPASQEQDEKQQALRSKVEELQRALADVEEKYSSSQQEVDLLKQEAEAQAQGSVALADHTQVVSSLGNAIKELESQSEALKQQLSQKTLQVDALQNRLTVEKDVTPPDSVPRPDHEAMREGLEGEVNHLTQLLQGALRKQDEMALEAAAAWQEARESRAEREALQELVMSREKENQTLSARLAEAQDAVSQLKQLVENHVSSEREKNKRIDDLSREVGKLKDALNSLSQLSYSSSSSPKRQQQNQQLETMQQQIKQLQYQLAESKKQHQETVSVYRMHLLYAVQGQMDEDVQKALKQILMMCKLPSQAKGAC